MSATCVFITKGSAWRGMGRNWKGKQSLVTPAAWRRWLCFPVQLRPFFILNFFSRKDFTMKKVAYFHARLTPTERAAVGAIAARDGLNVSEASRYLIREGAKALGVWPPKSEGLKLESKNDTLESSEVTQ
jgi:hypothetical protein